LATGSNPKISLALLQIYLPSKDLKKSESSACIEKISK
jgi:hypothetical protein